MCMRTYITHGFGVRCGSLSGLDLNPVLEKAPEFEASLLKWLHEADEEMTKYSSVKQIPVEELDRVLQDYEDDYGTCGKSAVIAAALREAHDIEILAMSDWDGIEYVFFPEALPWLFKPTEKRLTKESLCEIFCEVFGEDVTVDFVSVENFG